MKNSHPFRILNQLAFAVAIVFSTNHGVLAQSYGGDFKPTPPNSESQIGDSNSARELPDGFNALPFRNKDAQSSSNVVAGVPNATPVAQLPTRSTALTRPIQATKNPEGSGGPEIGPGTAGHGSWTAQPVSFGKSPASTPPVSTPPSQSTNQTPQDKSDGSSYVQEMPKFVDLNCSVKFIDDIKLPAKETGVIKTLEVKEGDFVPAGKIVGQIDDEMYRQMYVQADLRYKMALDAAQDETAKQAAEKKFGVASIEATKARKLAASGSKSDSERLMAEYTEQLAAIEIVKAELEMKKAKGEAELELARMKEVETRIRRHVLHSDFDAYVIEIFKKPQEFVNIGEEVMRIARMDKLWVQGIVDIRDLNPYEAMNRTVTVTVPLARGETTTFEGRIVNVALERQSSQHYMVKAEIKNRPVGGHWILQPFSEVQMRIHLDKPASDVGAAEGASVKR
jgi:HlyD family secretion protein